MPPNLAEIARLRYRCTMRGNAEKLIWTVLAASVLALAAVYWLQYARDVAPCTLCHYQRVPYLLAVPATIFALVVRREGFPIHWRQIVLGIVALGFAAGAALAVYHLGIEQQWWPGPASCTGGGSGAASVDQLRERLMATPVIRCDQVAWSVLGVSLAALNALASSVLAVLSGWAALLRRDV